MKAVLNEIVYSANHPNEAVNFTKLYQHTTGHDLRSLDQVCYEKLKHVHILGHESIYERDLAYFPDPHWYIDSSGEWLLVTGASEMQIRMVLSRCGAGLELLHIRFVERVDRIDISNLTGLKTLWICYNPALATVLGLENLHELTEAVLHFSGNDLSAAMNWPKLRYLSCRGCMSLVNTGGLKFLHNLKHLDLSYSAAQGRLCLDTMPALESVFLGGTKIASIELTHSLPSLKEFDASETMICDAQFLQHLPNVKRISLRSSSIREIPSLEELRDLEVLTLGRTNISTLEGVRFPASLRELWLDNMVLKELPDSIRDLKDLELLALRNTRIEALPVWLPDLGLDFVSTGYSDRGILLEHTEFPNVDMSIFEQSRELIVQWFEALRENEQSAPLNEAKVVFLGDGEAGKSLTIARLMCEGRLPEYFNSAATPGIAISDRQFLLEDGRTVQIHFWDFGGQEILHSMHRMFLTGRTLYVVVINVQYDDQNERARYWLHNIKSFADGSPVLMVLNKIDQNPYATINERDLRGLYPQLTEVVRLSALRDSNLEFNNKLTAALLRQLRDFPYLGTVFPPAWRKLKDCLTNMPLCCIRGSEYRYLCRNCGVEESEELQWNLLQWFHDLGVCFCCGDWRNGGLDEQVILRPEWITNVLYVILYNRIDGVRNGIVSRKDIARILCSDTQNNLPIRRVSTHVFYQEKDAEYVLKVLEQFHLCYSIDDDKVFIPMLCNYDSPGLVFEYADDPQVLEFRLLYEYLPSNVLYRLMVERRFELDMDHVWLTGARFVWKGTGLSAVVECEDRRLKLYVRSDNSRHLPVVYLCTLLDGIDRINRSIGLPAPTKQIVYSADGASECFDYDMLTTTLEHGLMEYYSRQAGDFIPVEAILGSVGFDARLEKEQLLRALLESCRQIAENLRYRSVSENMMHTMIRDSLTNRGFRVEDQTMAGISGWKQMCGDLDLSIRTASGRRYACGEVITLDSGNRNAAKQIGRSADKLLRYHMVQKDMSAFLVCFIRGEQSRFEETRRWCRESLRDTITRKPDMEIKVPVFQDSQPDRHTLSVVQYVYTTEAAQNLYLIMVPAPCDQE